MTAAAERFVTAAAEAIRARSRFMVALSGGSTPEALYRLLAAEPFRSRVEWPSVEIFWGDERCVPPDDAASNFRRAREALLDRVAIRPESIHRIRGEAEPAVAAQEYERLLRENFGTMRGPPHPGLGFDLVLLGLGPDGHTASLFPGSPELLEQERWALAVQAPIVPAWRVTLTPVVLKASLEMLFLVTGAGKAPALSRALEGSTPEPTRMVVPPLGTVRWLVDAGAAALWTAAGSPSA